MEINRVFIGFDPRQPVAYNVLQHSIIARATKPISITALVLETLPITRRGLTPFTFSRFLVPHMCNYEGWALFLDIDMLLADDITKLFDMRDDKYAVMVSKNPKRFEWASAMLFNCGHPANKVLTPEFVQTADALHHISWLETKDIGEFPNEWNHLVGYDRSNPHAKLIHYTQGIPAFPETADSEHAATWANEQRDTNRARPWIELMGSSIHALPDATGKMIPRYKLESPR